MSKIIVTQTKVCTKCGIEYPATTEYFYKTKHGKWGLNSACKRCCIAERVEYQKAHANECREYQQEWRKNNRDKQKIYDTRKLQRYPEKRREKDRIWRQNNPDKVRAKAQRRRAKKRALPATFTDSDWTWALEYFHGACAICQNPPSMLDYNRVLHQEHWIALENGGGYTPDNIIPVCQTCNLSKHDKHPEQWIIEKFGKIKSKKIIKRIQDYFADVESRTTRAQT